ncbi:MAG: lysoplasmalogenase family protein [Christensenellaceae bacterium]
MGWIQILILVVFLILLPIYIHAEKSWGFQKATTCKLALSGTVLINACIGLFITPFWLMQGFVILALVFAFCGDYFLQFIKLDAKKFNIGILCFSMTQVVLLVMMFLNAGVSWVEFVVLAGLLLLALILMTVQKWELGSARIPLSVYTLLLALMTGKAVSMLVATPSIHTALLAMGAVLFFVSDLLLGIWNFRTNKRLHANLNWVTYFCGILLISFWLAV